MAENLNAAAAQPMPGNEQKMIQSAGTRFKWLAVFAFLVTWLTLLGMLLGVADAYDAMTGDRAYRKHFSQDKAIAILQEGSGTQFDPKVVDAFVHVLEKHKQ